MVHGVHTWYIVYIHGTLCTYMVHGVHTWYIVYIHGTWCTYMVHGVHTWYIVYIHGTLCTYMVHGVHTWYIVCDKLTYQMKVHFQIYHLQPGSRLHYIKREQIILRNANQSYYIIYKYNTYTSHTILYISITHTLVIL